MPWFMQTKTPGGSSCVSRLCQSKSKKENALLVSLPLPRAARVYLWNIFFSKIVKYLEQLGVLFCYRVARLIVGYKVQWDNLSWLFPLALFVPSVQLPQVYLHRISQGPFSYCGLRPWWPNTSHSLFVSLLVCHTLLPKASVLSALLWAVVFCVH